MVCPGGCITQSETCVVQRKVVESIKMDCAPEGVNKTFTIGVNDKSEILDTVYTEYCDTENCNSVAKFHFDTNDIGPANGKHCESCFRANSKTECQSFDRVPCRGDQLSCLNFVGKILRGDGTSDYYAFTGCVSSIGCKLKFNALPGTECLEEIKFICTTPHYEARNCSGCP